MSRRNKESGQALVFGIATLGILLIGMAGLGIDMGYLRYQKRLLQTAADAAAIAGASNIAYGGIISGAQNAAAASGFTDASSNTLSTCTSNDPTSSALIGTVCVQVSNPPSSGPHSTDSNYVEAYVSTVAPTFFMKLLNTYSEPVTARAVATALTGGVNQNCMYTLGEPSKKIGVDINGHPTLNAPGCGIVDNGNFDPIGCSLTVTAGNFGVAGGDTGNCGQNPKITCQDQSIANCPSIGEPTVPDPIASSSNPLTPPCAPCTGGTSLSINTTQTVNPGTYSSISIQGSGTVTFNPGIYIFNGAGGFSCSGSPTINGNGVMFYFTGAASINCQGGDAINLTAPSSTNCATCPSQYDGVLMYQDPADTNTGLGQCPPSGNAGPQLGGNNGSSFNGLLYFPADQLDLSGTSGTTMNFNVNISASLCMSGNATFNIQGFTGPPPLSFVKNAVLVE